MENDLIERQAAIDAVNSHFGFNIEEEYGSAVQEVINGLPSAQPEIIRCRDCRYQYKGCNESESWNVCGYRPWLHVPTDDEHYCGYAERRADEQTD